MKRNEKEDLRKKSTEVLNKMKFDLQKQLIVAKANKFGFRPKIGTPIKLVRDIKKQIARVNTILNQRMQTSNSVERCKNKPYSKRRERRLKGKAKSLKSPKGNKEVKIK